MELTPRIGSDVPAHGGPIRAITSWPAAGGARRVAVGGHDGTIRHWDAETGEPLGQSDDAHAGAVLGLVSFLGADGARWLASLGADLVVRRWTEDGAPVGEPLSVGAGGDTGEVRLVACPGERPLLAFAPGDGTVGACDATTGALADIELADLPGGPQALAAWAGAAGARLAVGGAGGRVAVYELPGGRQLGSVETGGARAITALTTAVVGAATVLVAGDEGGSVHRLDPETGRARGVPVQRHDTAVRSLAAADETGGDAVVLSGAGDGTLRRTEVATGMPVGDDLAGHLAAVWTVAGWRRADGSQVFASAGDHGLVMWHGADGGAPIGVPLVSGSVPITHLVHARVAEPGDPSASRLGRLARKLRPACTDVLVTGAGDGVLRRWDAATGAPIGDPIVAHAGAVEGLVAWRAPDGSTVLGSAARGELKQFAPLADDATQVAEPIAIDDDGPIAGVVAGAQGTEVWVHVAVGSRILTFVAGSGEERSAIRLPSAPSALVSTPDYAGGDLLTAHPSDRTVRRWSPGGVSAFAANFPDVTSDARTYEGDGPARLVTYVHRSNFETPRFHFLSAITSRRAVTSWRDTLMPFETEPGRRKLQNGGVEFYLEPGPRKPPPADDAEAGAAVGWHLDSGPAVITTSTNAGDLCHRLATTDELIPIRFRGHAGAVHAIVSYPGKPQPSMASVGDDGTLRRWAFEIGPRPS